mgnify:CR=1 FL=1
MKFKFLLFLTPLILLSSCSDDEYVEVPIKQKPLYQYEPWYGDEGNPADSIPFPLVSELELYIENMRSLETNSEEVNFSGLLGGKRNVAFHLKLQLP